MAKTSIEFEVGKTKYRLDDDVLSWQLWQQAEAEKQSWRVIGYYTTLEAVAAQLYELGLRGSGATTFAELLHEAKGLRSEVRSAFALWETEERA